MRAAPELQLIRQPPDQHIFTILKQHGRAAVVLPDPSNGWNNDCSYDNIMSDTIASLKTRICELEEENAVLRQSAQDTRGRGLMRSGTDAENYLAQLIGGSTTPVNARYDVLSTDGRVRFEVKFSRLVPARGGCGCNRWQWARVRPADGHQFYDNLILVAEPDPAWLDRYRDFSAPYVLFDIPFKRVPEVILRLEMVQITTNPDTIYVGSGRMRRGRSTEAKRLLFEQFQFTPKELVARYGTY